WQRYQLKSQSGQVLWDFSQYPTYAPTTLAFADDGQFYHAVRDPQMGWYRVVDRTGWSIHTTFQDPILGLSMTSRNEFHLVMLDSFSGVQVLRDRSGRTLHTFDRNVQVLNLRVRAGLATYVVRDSFFGRLVVRTIPVPSARARGQREAARVERFDRLHGR
ncbi:MAG: hypothetical protein HY815_07035, partial [Candidatus Riflebacteria bacterium]|nr:hypothetical protein [Candidatus Riflebacteria bacterium]